MTMFRCWVVAWALFGGSALAQGLEIIHLRHRLADQVIPELRPLLAPGATLSGEGNLLLLRTTPANLAELRQVLDVLDRPLRRLVISVRHAGRQAAQGGGVTVDAGIGRGAVVISGSVSESRSTRGEHVAQRVQTVEGGRAFINVGQSSPVATRQVVQTPRGTEIREILAYRDTGTGFHVEPRLVGDQVTLAIVTANDAPGALPGSAEVRRVVSTVSGRLGEWISLAGSVQQAEHGSGGFGATSRGEAMQVWLMVEELP